MTLSKAVSREPIHQRKIDCQGYRRNDGHWDIEGHLVDTKAYSFENKWRGTINPDTPLHEMWLRLTIDNELNVLDAEACTLHSPYPECPNFPDKLHLLKGLRIAPGWNNAVHKRLGGTNGCTHITEILGRVANVAFQTVMPFMERHDERQQAETKPRILDTCHALDSKGPVVKREWPQFYVEL